MFSPYPFVPRKQWNAREPKSWKKLQLPVSKIILHKSNSRICFYSSEQCEYYVRKLQKFHMTLDHLADIKYNFLITADDKVYEGRGWQLQGEHTEGMDDKSIGIAFLRKYADPPPDQDEMNLVKELIKDGVKRGYISDDFQIIPHGDLSDDTICPGLVNLHDLMMWQRDFKEELRKKKRK